MPCCVLQYGQTSMQHLSDALQPLAHILCSLLYALGRSESIRASVMAPTVPTNTTPEQVLQLQQPSTGAHACIASGTNASLEGRQSMACFGKRVQGMLDLL